MAYASLSEFALYGLSAAALTRIPSDIQSATLEGASGYADTYLRKAGYAVPIPVANHALKRAVCHIAAYDALVTHGFAAEGTDAEIKARRDSAIEWLESVADGSIAPMDPKDDATPSDFEGMGAVDSADARGW